MTAIDQTVAAAPPLQAGGRPHMGPGLRHAKAGVQGQRFEPLRRWIPAFARMTGELTMGSRYSRRCRAGRPVACSPPGASFAGVSGALDDDQNLRPVDHEPAGGDRRSGPSDPLLPAFWADRPSNAPTPLAAPRAIAPPRRQPRRARQAATGCRRVLTAPRVGGARTSAYAKEARSRPARKLGMWMARIRRMLSRYSDYLTTGIQPSPFIGSRPAGRRRRNSAWH
jgi:hypothetical protein